MATKKEPKFNEALSELQGIVQKMESEEVDIDALSAHVKRAQELVSFCRKKLLKTQAGLEKLLKD